MEIAVLVNENKMTVGFESDGTILVYGRENCAWRIKRQMEYRIAELTDAPALHHKLREICGWLEECKIMVVSRIRGIHYLAFEEFQISMLEIKGNPEYFLEDIRECVNHQRTQKKVPMEHNAIHQRQPGKYYTDLRDVMSGKTSYNSKQILLPFIRNETYSVLEILCEHVPKWLEKEQKELKIKITIESYEDCMRVNVYPG